MLAYHNDPAIKTKLLADLQAHAAADRLVKGQYWENGKGCAVGCTLQSLGATQTNKHEEYERLLGIPQMLAQLEDRIFEGLPNADAMKWPMRFSNAINPGADLSRVGWKFLHWLLTDELPKTNDERVNAAIAECADVLVPLMRGELVNYSAAAYATARAAAYAAARAADAAYATADAAADAAAYATARAAAYATARAADAAAYAAAYAADAAADAAAYSAAYSAADAGDDAVDAAREKSYQRMSDKLLQLLEDAK